MDKNARCCVRGCDNDKRYPDRFVKHSNIVGQLCFHKFPTNEEMRKVWEYKIGNTFYIVCCIANPGFTTCTPVDFSIVIPVSCRHEKVKVPNIPSIFWIAPFILTEPLRLPLNFSTDLMKPRHGHGVGQRRSSDFLTSKDSNHAMACLTSYGHRVLPSSNKIFVYMTTFV